MTTTKRQCKQCQKTKQLNKFDVNMRTKTKTYYKHTCTKCRNEQKAILRQLHKDNPKPADCTCPICKGENQDLVLDHNHITGEFRGWICNDCNSAIGKLGDSHEVLARAIAYLLV